MNENTMNAPNCAETRSQLQDYLDQTLSRKASMALFLHVRECEGCRAELESLERLYGLLGGLPAAEPPVDFDARILESVPYAAYKAMEPLRRERMPVILDEEALPVFVRAGITRAVGGLVAVATAVGLATDVLPGGWTAVGLVGALPEALISLQSVSRRIYTGVLQRTSAN